VLIYFDNKPLKVIAVFPFANKILPQATVFLSCNCFFQPCNRSIITTKWSLCSNIFFFKNQLTNVPVFAAAVV